MRNKYAIIFLASVIILVGLLVGYGIYVNATSGAHVEKLAAAQYSRVTGAQTRGRAIAPVAYISALTLQSLDMLDIRVKIDGTVTKLYVLPGDQVKAGQLLAELTNDELASQILQAEGTINQAKANYIQYEQTVKRYRELTSQGAISQQKMDEAIANQSVAAAQIMSNQAYRDQLASRLESQKIVAPVTGDVLKVYQAPGAFIRAGDSVAMIGDFSSLYAGVTVRQEIVEQLLPLDAKFKLAVRDNQPMDKSYTSGFRGKSPAEGKDFTITLVKVEPPLAVPSEYRSIFWKIDNSANILEPGTYHQVKIYGEEKRWVLSIPRNALKGEHEPFTVLVVGKDNRLEERRIKTGVRNDDYVQVLAGLEENDIVVVSGKTGLSPGMKVQVTVDAYSDPGYPVRG